MSGPVVIGSDMGYSKNELDNAKSYQIPVSAEGLQKNITIYINLLISGMTPDNLSIMLLTASEYEKFRATGSISGLTSLISFSGQQINSNSTLLDCTLSLALQGTTYLLIWNETMPPVDSYLILFFSVTSPFYMPGVLVTCCGTYILLATIAWHLAGWKRYFTIGTMINLIPFFIKVVFLPTFTGSDFPPGNILHPELYADFSLYYVDWINDLMRGIQPYSSQMTGYVYPPAFLYTLAAFWCLPLPPWRLALPIFACIIGTAYLIFKIVKKITHNERRATWAMLLYFLNPFTLVYGSFLWINTSIFTFFVVLAFYFALSQKNGLAMFTLGIATMFKQFVVIFFPLLLVLILRSRSKQTSESGSHETRDLFKALGLYCLPIGLVSLPFLLTNPLEYLQRVLLEHVGFSTSYLTTFVPSLGMPVTFNSFFLWVETSSFLTTSFAFLLQFYILLGASIIIICILAIVYPKHKNLGRDATTNAAQLVVEGLFLSILLVICFQLFYPRGSYKYYLMLLTPFITIFYDDKHFLMLNQPREGMVSFRKQFLTSMILSWIIFWCNRYIYFFLLLTWLIFLFRKNVILNNKLSEIENQITKINANSKVNQD